jgi:hypothetical protein
MLYFWGTDRPPGRGSAITPLFNIGGNETGSGATATLDNADRHSFNSALLPSIIRPYPSLEMFGRSSERF